MIWVILEVLNVRENKKKGLKDVVSLESITQGHRSVMYYLNCLKGQIKAASVSCKPVTTQVRKTWDGSKLLQWFETKQKW